MALFDITEAVQQRGIRKRRIVLPPIMITSARAGQLATIHRRMLEPWTRSAARILPLYERELQRRLTTDSADELDLLFTEIGQEVSRLILDLTPAMAAWAIDLETWHRTKWASNLLAGTEIDISNVIGPAGAQESIDDFMRRNTALIRNVSDETRAKIADLVFRGLQERAGSRAVAREITRQLGISRRRAIRIASDQANKLGAALDRQRSREAGFEFWIWRHSGKLHFRPEHKARNGKIYTDANAPADLPGQLPFCGCVRQATIITDEAEAARIRARKRGAEIEGAGAPPPPPVQPVAEPVVEVEPEAPQPRTGFRSPINPDVTGATIAVRKRAQVQKELTAQFAEAQASAEIYKLPREFKGRDPKDWGKAALGSGFTDEAASMIAAIKPELDNLADQLGIPRLRGFKTIPASRRGTYADMGDGVMAINPSYFNEYAARGNVGGRGGADRSAELERKWLDLEKQLDPYKAELEQLKQEWESAVKAGDRDRESEIIRRRWKVLEDYRKAERKSKKAYLDFRTSGRIQNSAPASSWKPGDDVGKRPFGVFEYFSDGVDQARSMLFHEFGHHVHQYLGKTGWRPKVGKPPLESAMDSLRRQTTPEFNRVLSKYGTSSSHEWFAETFSAFVMGRRDLLEPEAIDLMERIFDGRYP